MFHPLNIKTMKTLKKSIACAALITAMFVNTSYAQQNTMPTPLVQKAFTATFEKATDIKWKYENPLYVATFLNDKESSVAFLDQAGNLFAQGRIINDGLLPLKVKSSLQPIQNSFEKKYGALARGSIFEIIDENDYTDYYIFMQNSNHHVMVTADMKGNVIVKRDDFRNTTRNFETNIVASLMTK
jgi:hypothetical protein